MLQSQQPSLCRRPAAENIIHRSPRPPRRIHGLGDTAAGWADIAGMLQPDLPTTKFVFPTAPVRPITLNGGMRMTGW